MNVWKWVKVWAKSLFPHDKWVRYVLLLFVLGVIGAAVTVARAEETTLLFDAGVQYIRGPAASITMHVEFDGPKDASIEAGLFLIGRVNDSRLGIMGGEALLVDGFGRWDLGLGLAVTNVDHPQLGSRLNFALMARCWLKGNWYVAIRHWSNAGTTEENIGLDLIQVGKRL